MSDQDSIFFRNFSILLAALVVLTVVLALIGISMQNNLVANVQGQADRSSIQKSIEPVAAVNTDPNAVMAVAPVAVAVCSCDVVIQIVQSRGKAPAKEA